MAAWFRSSLVFEMRDGDLRHPQHSGVSAVSRAGPGWPSAPAEHRDWGCGGRGLRLGAGFRFPGQSCLHTLPVPMFCR